MEQLKLLALRDFAIDFSPRAQKTRLRAKLMTDEHYHYALFGDATLTSPTAPATEQAAASLLRNVTSLLIAWPDGSNASFDQRQQMIHQTILDAQSLCMLTGTTFSWLPSTSEVKQEVAPSKPLPEAAPHSPSSPLPPPGINLTTEEAAILLRVEPDTMRKWRRNGTGPLTAVTQGRRLGWRSADILRLLEQGWRPRGR